MDNKRNLLVKRKPEIQEEQIPQKHVPPATNKQVATKAADNKKSAAAIEESVKISMDSAVYYYQEGTKNPNTAYLNKSLEFITKVIKEAPGHPAAYYYAGLIRRRFNENEKARINFERAINDPDLGYNAHFYLGKIYGDMKKYQQSIDNFEKYIAKTDYTQGKVEAQNLINTYKKLWEEEIAANPPIDIKDVVKKDIAEALSELPPQIVLKEIEVRIEADLSMAIVDSTTNEGQDLLEGVRLFNNKEYDKAIASFRKVIEKYPGKPSAGSAVYNVGVCLFKLHKWDTANKEFVNYMSRYPKGAMFENALFLSGVSLREQMKNNDAQKMFNDYIRNNRNGKWTGKAYEKLGDIYLDLDQQSQAIEAFKQADALAANNDDKLYARYKTAEVYHKLKNGGAAEKTYLSVIALGEEVKSTANVPQSYYRLADYYYQNKKWAEAGNYYVKATRLFPDYSDTPWGLYQIANCLYHSNKYKEAIDGYDFLKDKFPDDYWTKEAEFRRNDAVWKYQYKQGN
jgi:tetratricopeptide (TPR) repeat protein